MCDLQLKENVLFVLKMHLVFQRKKDLNQSPSKLVYLEIIMMTAFVQFRIWIFKETNCFFQQQMFSFAMFCCEEIWFYTSQMKKKKNFQLFILSMSIPRTNLT